MSSRPFVHLHCHSHYSLLDGASKVSSLVQRAKALGMPALAVTDHGNLYGAVEFLREAKAHDLKPIIGIEAYVAPGRRSEKGGGGASGKETAFHLTLLARNGEGVRNLMRLSSASFLEGYYYKPRIDKEILERHSKGLICLSGCVSSEFSDHILHDKRAEAEALAAWYLKVFGAENFYIEIQDNGIAIQRDHREGAVALARRMGLPLVATSDAHYLTREDAPAHDILLCVNTGATVDEPNRFRFENDQFFVRSPDEMYEAMPEHAEALATSVRISELVEEHYKSLNLGKRLFPSFRPPGGQTPEDYLRALCLAGLAKRYGPHPEQAARDRLEHELGTICRMGFASYFLIVWDFVRFAREAGIPNSARGSACGSLVSYVLEISHVCPLKYDLLFERFLDPNRSEAPDIDIDLCKERRYEVIEYVKKKYGAENVAQIGTFGTMAAKAALKDVGRALNIPLARVDQVTKLVPTRLNITLEDALKEEPALRRLRDEDPEIDKLYEYALRLEGTIRNVGTHAAGVVIADQPLRDLVPLQRIPNKDKDKEVISTQWEMGDVEKAGLLKMDFLGLRNLTSLAAAVALVERRTGKPLDLFSLPLDDEATYKLLQRGDAKGVFQLDGAGIRDLLVKMKPDRFADLIAILALYRPGPLNGGMVDEYVDVKHGRKQASYAHPVMKEVLEETYGIMCIHEETRISLADGSEKPIKAVRRGHLVHSLNYATNRFEIKECHGCGPTRRGDGLKITLENGFAVTLTDDHQVLTFEGLKPAGELDPAADLVATGLSLPQSSCLVAPLADWLGSDEDVAYFFGYLVGDGCLTGSGITLATGEEEAHIRLSTWLADRFPLLRQHAYFSQRSWYLSLSCGLLLGHSDHGNRKTRLHHLLEAHGLKVRALEKRVPEAIFQSGPSIRSAFLAGLIDADGCLTQNRRGVGIAFVTSVSPGLLEDIRRLGQLAGIAVHLRKDRVHFWDTRRLREAVGPQLVVKEFVGRLLAGATTGWAPRDRVLQSVAAGESLRSFCRRTTIERSGLGHPFPFVKSSTANKAGIDLGDVRYFRIKSIERVFDQQFYGMSVADHHNLVANGVVIKNCYQEQVMRLLNRLGSIDLSQAYACIKAISKKKTEVIAQGRKQFLSGAVGRGLDEGTATRIFELIEYFGGYGFNKSHSTAYALVAFQTAYLKAHYPTEFMAALLSSEMDGAEREKYFVEHIEDCRRMGIEVLPPDINEGEASFRVACEGKIHFGLAAIKGVGFKAVDALVEARKQGGPFLGLDDLFARVPLGTVSQACVEALIKAGAFDRLGGKRSQWLAVLPRSSQAGQSLQEDRKRGQRNLFDAFDDAPATGNGTAHAATGLPDIPELPDAERLAEEKKVLGFYMSSHPLTRHAAMLQALATHQVADLARAPEKAEIILGGMIVNVQIKNVQKSRSGLTRMGKLTFEDLTGTVPAMLWPEEFAKNEDLIKNDQIGFVKGTLDRRRDPAELIISRFIPLERGPGELSRGVVVRLHKGVHQAEDLERLLRLVRVRPGNLDLYLEIMGLERVRRAIYKAGASLKVRHDDRLVADLEGAVGAGNVRLLGQRGATARVEPVAAPAEPDPDPIDAPPEDDEL